MTGLAVFLIVAGVAWWALRPVPGAAAPPSTARSGAAITAADAEEGKAMADGEDRREGWYKIGIVGESNYSAAIATLHKGQALRILHEIGNPYDDDALVVKTKAGAGKTIGYIGRSSWLREAIHDEGKGCIARVASVGRGDGGNTGVVVEVRLTSAAVGTVDYDR